MGNKENIKLFNEDELDKCHLLLNEKVIIMSGDYLKTGIIADIANREGVDFIYYLDPPYKPISDTSSFTLYTKKDFNDKDQEELKKFCDYVNHKGGKFVLSNSKCGNYFDELYKGYSIEIVEAKRNINSKGEKRGFVEELLISNYKYKKGLF